MRVRIERGWIYDFRVRAESLLQIEAAIAVDQTVVEERLVFDPPDLFVRPRRPAQRRTARGLRHTRVGWPSPIPPPSRSSDREMDLAGVA